MRQRGIETILKRPGNNTCAECPERLPSFAVLLNPVFSGGSPLAVFCCKACYRYHFDLGRKHCSEVKSLSTAVTQWSPAEVEILAASGNQMVNDIYEATLQEDSINNDKEIITFDKHEEAELRRAFIHKKYVARKYFCEIKYHQTMVKINPHYKIKHANNKYNHNPQQDKLNNQSKENKEELKAETAPSASATGPGSGGMSQFSDLNDSVPDPDLRSMFGLPSKPQLQDDGNNSFALPSTLQTKSTGSLGRSGSSPSLSSASSSSLGRPLSKEGGDSLSRLRKASLLSAGPSRRNLMRERKEEEEEEAGVEKTETNNNHHDAVEETDVAIAAATAAMDTGANANLVRELSTRSLRGNRRSMMTRTSSLRKPGSERGRRSCFANSSALDAFTTPPRKEVVRNKAKGNKPSLKKDLLDLDDSDSDTDVRRTPNPHHPRGAPSSCGKPSKSERGNRTTGFASAVKGHKPIEDRDDPAAEETDSDSDSESDSEPDTESCSSVEDNSSRRRHGILKRQHSSRQRQGRNKAPAYHWESHLDDSASSKDPRGHSRQARKTKSFEDVPLSITRSHSAKNPNPCSHLKKKPSRRKLVARKVTRLDGDDDCSMDSSHSNEDIAMRGHGKASISRTSSVGSRLGSRGSKSPDTKLKKRNSARNLSDVTAGDNEKPMKRCSSAGTLEGTVKSSKREPRRGDRRAARRARRQRSNSSNTLERKHIGEETDKTKETDEKSKTLTQSASAGILGLLVTSEIDKQKNEKARATAERFKAITKCTSAASLGLNLTTPAGERGNNQRLEKKKKEGAPKSTSAGSLGLLIAAAAARDKTALTPSNISKVRQMTAMPKEKIDKHNKAFSSAKKSDLFDKKFEQFLSNRNAPKLGSRISEMKKNNSFANALAQSKDKSDMLSAWLVSPTET